MDYIVIWILVVHWIADFVLQSDSMAKGKSSSNVALGKHVGVYTAVVALGTLNIGYAVVNGVIHGAVDYLTSRWTSRLWKKGDVHNFFVVIGLDQLIHVVTLLATYKYMIGN